MLIVGYLVVIFKLIFLCLLKFLKRPKQTFCIWRSHKYSINPTFHFVSVTEYRFEVWTAKGTKIRNMYTIWVLKQWMQPPKVDLWFCYLPDEVLSMMCVVGMSQLDFTALTDCDWPRHGSNSSPPFHNVPTSNNNHSVIWMLRSNTQYFITCKFDFELT